MPECFRLWLESLSDKDAELMWEYLDNTLDNAIEEIMIIAKSHPQVELKVCGELADRDIERDIAHLTK